MHICPCIHVQATAEIWECSIHICTYAHAYTYRLQLKYGKKYIFYFLTDTFFALYWCLRVSIINYYKLLLFHNTSGITGLFVNTVPYLDLEMSKIN